MNSFLFVRSNTSREGRITNNGAPIPDHHVERGAPIIAGVWIEQLLAGMLFSIAESESDRFILPKQRVRLT